MRPSIHTYNTDYELFIAYQRPKRTVPEDAPNHHGVHVDVARPIVEWPASCIQYCMLDEH